MKKLAAAIELQKKNWPTGILERLDMKLFSHFFSFASCPRQALFFIFTFQAFPCINWLKSVSTLIDSQPFHESLFHIHALNRTHTHTLTHSLHHSHAFYLASHSLCLSVSIRLSTHNFSFPLTSSTYAASVSSFGIPVSSLSLSVS